MKKTQGFSAILVPSTTVFISSFCIMVLELVASRLIARHLGSSLYTWTAVIGIVLSGITIGNYIGGRIADRFTARKALSIIFLLSSASCVLTVILNNIVGDWMFLWYLSWLVRVFSHVAIVFMLPSVLLGTISPVVAKMALDKGLPQGRTVGDIYAFGAAGSIAGTFAAGYYLIATMGTVAIVWSVATALLFMSVFYWSKSLYAYLYAALFLFCVCTGTLPFDWAQAVGASADLRAKHDKDVLYEDETQYCDVTVKQSTENPNRRYFIQGNTNQSEILMDQPDELQVFYTIIFAAITHGMSKGKEKLSIMHIGGGGYVFPRYVEKYWPGSRNIVVEIDTGDTEAAMAAFGLSRTTTINTIQMDARNYIDRLMQGERQGEILERYDFICEDAFTGDYSVPFQLATKEFNDKIYHILKDDGTYIANTIDIYTYGRFVGAYINTLKQTFDHVQVISVKGFNSGRNNFVIIASKIPFDAAPLIKEYDPDISFWHLSDYEIENLRKKAEYVTLTDDYAPVENMLMPVVRQKAVDLLVDDLSRKANDYQMQGNFIDAIKIHKKIIEADPSIASMSYNRIGIMMTHLGRFDEAIQAFQASIRHNEHTSIKVSHGVLLYNIGIAYNESDRARQAKETFRKAAEMLRKELDKNPDSIDEVICLGNTLAELGNFTQATYYFKKAIQLEPYNAQHYITLGKALCVQGKYDGAISMLQQAAELMRGAGNYNSEFQIRNYLREVQKQRVLMP